MIYTSEDGQSIDFWNHDLLPTNPKRIGVSLSSGADSAILMYITCEMFKDNSDIEFIPVTSNRVGRADNTPLANNIIKWMRKQFPIITIRDTEDHTYHKEADEEAIKFDEEDFCNRHNIDVFINGSNLNPNSSVFEYTEHEQHEFKRMGRYLSKPGYETLPYKFGKNSVKYYPFRTVDKKFTAYLYRYYDLMGSLFPMTYSCTFLMDTILQPELTPCKNCFWCREKYWAFNRYDGDIKDRVSP